MPLPARHETPWLRKKYNKNIKSNTQTIATLSSGKRSKLLFSSCLPVFCWAHLNNKYTKSFDWRFPWTASTFTKNDIAWHLDQHCNSSSPDPHQASIKYHTIITVYNIKITTMSLQSGNVRQWSYRPRMTPFQSSYGPHHLRSIELRTCRVTSVVSDGGTPQALGPWVNSWRNRGELLEIHVTCNRHTYLDVYS